MGQMDKEARLVRSTVPPEERAKVVLDATSRVKVDGTWEGDDVYAERLRALLWKVAESPVVGSSETHYAVALTSEVWHDVMDAAGYDEMGQ